MANFLGIDIGTSAVKALLLDGEGSVLATASCGYEVSRPREGWSEQDPHVWWMATRNVVQQVMRERPRGDVAAIGLSGQMHGSVMVRRGAVSDTWDADDVVRPAILWNDQRTALQCWEIEAEVGGRRRLVDSVGNAALPGFTLPKLLWVRKSEPREWYETGLVLMPKDYIRWKLTGEAATDVGDASGTLLFDVARRRWSPEMCRAMKIDEGLLPRVLESGEIAGRTTAWASEETDLPVGVPVIAGSGDNMMGAIGAGIVSEGAAVATLGTSGVLYAHTNQPRPDLGNPEVVGRTHAMCAATGTAASRSGWCATGCMLSAAGALAWARENIAPGVPFDSLIAEAERVPMGCEGLVFLPHLTGERCPYPDPSARGGWVGLTARHTRAHLVRAVIEGVTFTMGQILDIFRATGIRPERIRLGGGGAKSAFWRQMQADVYGVPVSLPNTEEGPALGAALLAGVAAGAWRTIDEACDAVIRETEVREPDASAVARYRDIRSVHEKVYPALGTAGVFAAAT